MDPFITTTVIPAIVVFVISILIGWFGKSGWDSIIMGKYATFKNMFINFGPAIKAFDEQLYTDLENVINTLDAAFADNAITMAEFNAILKTFKPFITRIEVVIAFIASKKE